jgi:putative ABC transport system permease protein
MLKNYLLIAIRNVRRRKGHAFINIAGLTIGLACCLLIFQHVAFEYSFDRFHENEAELYRAVVSISRGEPNVGATYTPQAMGPALEASIPEITRFTRVHAEFAPALVSIPSRPGQVFEETEVLHVDRSFLEMFTFPLVEGDPREALQPGTALISERLAQKYFGGASPIGEELDFVGITDRSYRVSGVLRNVPANSHLQFEMLLPVEHVLETGQYVDEPEGGWSFNNFITYIQLHPDADPAEADRKMTELFIAERRDALREYGFREEMRLYGQPLRDVYLNADVHAFVTASSSYRTVYFFTIIGLITLLIALVNYVNLATARALDRAREVGVRKSVGAQRKQLITQFMSESGVTIGVAALLAVALAVALTPVVNNLADTHLTRALWLNPGFWAAFLGTLAACTLLAGLYPAFVLSSFRPAAVLKGKSESIRGHLWLRRGLVVFQFAAAVVLIGGTAVVYHQLDYMRSMNLGLDLEQVITVEGPRVLEEGVGMAQARMTLADELRRLPGVLQVATSQSVPGEPFNWQGASTWRAEREQDTAIEGVVTYLDSSFVPLYGLEVIAGSNFTDAHPTWGVSPPNAVLANETAVSRLGFASPHEALDQLLMIGGVEARIVGVLRDFNWSSAHTARESAFFGRTPGGRRISLNLSTADLPATLAAIEDTYLGMFPGNVFHYRFADEAFAAQYRDDQRFATLFSLFAGLAILIACLGLFGLATFTAQQRAKEIGVRKVLGASVAALVGLLSKDFLKLVAMAVVIGSPVIYWVMTRWLEGFAYRIDVGPGIFLAVALLMMVIALVTVSVQSIRAAMADPVKAIRAE